MAEAVPPALFGAGRAQSAPPARGRAAPGGRGREEAALPGAALVAVCAPLLPPPLLLPRSTAGNAARPSRAMHGSPCSEMGDAPAVSTGRAEGRREESGGGGDGQRQCSPGTCSVAGLVRGPSPPRPGPLLTRRGAAWLGSGCGAAVPGQSPQEGVLLRSPAGKGGGPPSATVRGRWQGGSCPPPPSPPPPHPSFRAILPSVAPPGRGQLPWGGERVGAPAGGGRCRPRWDPRCPPALPVRCPAARTARRMGPVGSDPRCPHLRARRSRPARERPALPASHCPPTMLPDRAPSFLPATRPARAHPARSPRSRPSLPVPIVPASRTSFPAG